MINSRSLSEKYPITEANILPKNETNQEYFIQGHELALLVNTSEGDTISEQAKLIITQIVEKSRESTKPRSSTAGFEGDITTQNQIRLDNLESIKTWQKQNEAITTAILFGQQRLDNNQQRTLLKIQNPDWNDGLQFTPEQTSQVQLFHDYCRQYGQAVDYQRRQNTPDSNRLPLDEPGSAKLKFGNTNINQVREHFRQGWQSVPPMIKLSP